MLAILEVLERRAACLPKGEEAAPPHECVCIGWVLEADVKSIAQESAVPLRPKCIAKQNLVCLFLFLLLPVTYIRCKRQPLEMDLEQEVQVVSQAILGGCSDWLRAATGNCIWTLMYQ